MKRTLTHGLGLALTFTLALGACVEQSQELTSSEREQLHAYVSTTAPTPQHRLDARLEDRVVLLGYDIDQETVAPGGTFTVTWYWHVTRALDDGWHLFTHVVDADNVARLNQDGVGFVREHYPPGRWQRGEYIKDPQTVTIGADWPAGSVTMYLGMWNGPNRLRVLSGPHDGDNRIRGVTLPVGAAAAPPSPPGGGVIEGRPAAPAAPPGIPNLSVIKTSSPVTIDGQTQESAWQAAAHTPRFVDTMSGGAASFAASAQMTWDDQNLYVAFAVADDYIHSTFTHHDEHMWEQDTIELMIDPGADQRNYFEIQVAPTGQTFDTRYDTRRQPMDAAHNLFGHMDWESHVNAKVMTRDGGYAVELAIPWTAFAAGTPPAGKPASGDTWGINLYAMDTRSDGSQRACGWSAVRVPDFHALDHFARVTFVDPAAAAAHLPPPPPTAPVVVPAGPGHAIPPLMVNGRPIGAGDLHAPIHEPHYRP